MRTLLVTYANGVTHTVRLPPDASLDDAVRTYSVPGASVVSAAAQTGLSGPENGFSGHVGGGDTHAR